MHYRIQKNMFIFLVKIPTNLNKTILQFIIFDFEFKLIIKTL